VHSGGNTNDTAAEGLKSAPFLGGLGAFLTWPAWNPAARPQFSNLAVEAVQTPLSMLLS
jgi:hypothetical protein